MIDLDEWLTKRGIPRIYADNVAAFVKARYPELTRALKQHKEVGGELELVALVRDVQTGQVPSFSSPQG